MTSLKEYRELKFSDDFMFCKVLTNNPDLCKVIIETCISSRIGNISYIHAQESIKAGREEHGVRLDVYVEDDENQSFDLDMESRYRGFYPERTRYYLGMIDRRTFRQGMDYSRLKDNYVIFFLPSNPFPEEDLHRYTFVSRCREQSELELGDRWTRIFLCPGDSYEDIPKDLARLLEYIRTGVPTDELTNRIEEEVEKARMRDDWEDDYIIWYNTVQDYKNEGREEGQAMMIRRLFDNGMPAEEIARYNEMPLDEVMKIIEEAPTKTN